MQSKFGLFFCKDTLQDAFFSCTRQVNKTGNFDLFTQFKDPGSCIHTILIFYSFLNFFDSKSKIILNSFLSPSMFEVVWSDFKSRGRARLRDAATRSTFQTRGRAFGQNLAEKREAEYLNLNM